MPNASDSPSSTFASSDGDMDMNMDIDIDSDTTTNGHRSDHEVTPRPEPVNENAPVTIMPVLGRLEQRATERYDVCIVGAGPAGLMLGLILARLGINPLILDERAEQTPAGRADGMQPKTIETLRMLGLADELLQQGVKVFDICLWHSSSSSSSSGVSPSAESPEGPPSLRRVARETHYPAFIVDLVDPFILIGHQGMVEKVFVADLAKRGVSVHRGHRFEGLSRTSSDSIHDDDDDNDGDKGMCEILASANVTRSPRTFRATYLVGCDGAHSRVRELLTTPHSNTNNNNKNNNDDDDNDDDGTTTTAAAEARADDEPSSSTGGGGPMSVWGVLDGELDTDFPDIWTKSVVFSEQFGSLLIIPRERDMTRLYIEMRPDADSAAAASSNPGLVQAAIMRRAAQILLPYRVRWRRVEWFGQYRVSQRVAAKFASSLSKNPTTSSSTTAQSHHLQDDNDDDDDDNDGTARPPRIFIAGDAAHTHSPKAAQGMNTALHDSWNLAWKLNLAIRGLCRPAVLLGSYESERQKIARDLVAFDFEHANEMSRGDPAALAENFRKNVRFVSGVGVEYGANALNQDGLDVDDDDDNNNNNNNDDNRDNVEGIIGGVRPGCTLPPGKVSRYIDANPVDVQLDIPVLGQFRVYIFVPDVAEAAQTAFLKALCDGIADTDSLMSRLSAAASRSYLERPRVPSAEDIFRRPERYTAVSQLFLFALITSTPKSNFELAHLPPILSRSPWTIYLDNVPDLDTQGSTCTAKYLGPPESPHGLRPDEIALLNVRPDGYVGSVKKWSLRVVPGDNPGDKARHSPADLGKQAAKWLEEYFGSFLAVP